MWDNFIGKAQREKIKKSSTKLLLVLMPVTREDFIGH